MTTMSPGDALRARRAATRSARGCRHQSKSHMPQLQPASLYPARSSPSYIVALRHPAWGRNSRHGSRPAIAVRSEEHTSELQSPCKLVCRLLLEEKTKHHNKKYACDMGSTYTSTRVTTPTNT